MFFSWIKFEKGLRRQENWENARCYIEENLPDNLTIKKEYLIQILNTFHERNKEIETYDGIPEKSLVSKIFFFRPKDTLFANQIQHNLSEVKLVSNLLI